MYRLTCAIMLMLPSSLFAQAPAADSTAPAPVKNQWIEPMNNFIGLKLTQNSDVADLGVSTEDNDVYLRPNASSVSRLSFNYRFLSFGFNFIPKFLPGNDDDDIRGKTKGGGFNFGLNFKRWINELSYSKTKGYYLENTADYDSDWKEGDPYIQFPELVYKNFQVSTGYKFNPNYSLNAVATQTERQLKSAGSFMPDLMVRYYIIDDQTPLTGTNSSQKSNNVEVMLGAGYYHTFVFAKNFYAALGLTPNAGMVFTKLTTRMPDETIETNSESFIFRLDGRAGAGYNGPRFFAGIYGRAHWASFQQEGVSVINHDNRITLQAFIGYRLNAPKWMRENVDKAEALIPKL